MKKFEVTITETLKKKVEVEAETQEEAEQIVTDEWYKGDHILDADNFTEVIFEAKEKEPEKIKVVLLEPGKVARATEIDSPLKGMQDIVGGNIDVVSLPDALLIHNREGKQKGLPFNRGLCDETGKVRDVIAGTCFVCDSKEDEFISLSEKQTEEYLKRFKHPEKFYRTDNGIAKVPYNPNKNKEHKREWGNEK